MKRCPTCGLTYPGGSIACFVDGAELDVIPDPRIGTTVDGRYLIDSVLGEGGMATVYGARSRLGDTRYAVKVMGAGFSGNAVSRERFLREARAAERLAHDNIVEVLGQGETADGCLYFVMEELVGESLADRLDRGSLPLEDALPILIQIGRALARAHGLGVIHRDLKPENVFLVQRHGAPLVKLLDFGIARTLDEGRITNAGEVFGTPQYMAPERIESRDAGPSADLYSLGCLVYELLTGERAFDGADIPTIFIKQLREPPPSLRAREPSAPIELERLYLQLVEKKEANRPVDARAALAALEQVAGAIGVRVPVESFAPTPIEPRVTLSPVDIDRWQARVAIFESLLAQAYGARRPPAQEHLLQEVKRLVREVASLRQEAAYCSRELDAAEAEGREGRARIGYAVDELVRDLSLAREAQKEAMLALERVDAKVQRVLQEIKELGRRVLQLEGRTGLTQPLPQLPEMLRRLADAHDRWAVLHAEREPQRELASATSAAVHDLDYQVNQLRTRLTAYEEDVAERVSQSRLQMGSLGKRADELEAALLPLASRLCDPLRTRPELRELFARLEAETPGSSERPAPPSAEQRRGRR